MDLKGSTASQAIAYFWNNARQQRYHWIQTTEEDVYDRDASCDVCLDNGACALCAACRVTDGDREEECSNCSADCITPCIDKGCWYPDQQPSSIPEISMHWESLDDDAAVCMDGTRAGYYISNIDENPSTRWVLLFGGDHWCYDTASCVRYCSEAPDNCGSTSWNSTKMTDNILSTKIESLQGYTRVYVPQCSGDAFMGDGARDGQEFRGSVIFKSVIQQLMDVHGLGSQDNSHVLISGYSAGARGVMVHLDQVPAMLGQESSNRTVVEGVLMSSLWVEGVSKLRSNKPSLVEQTQLVDQSVGSNILPSCNYNQTDQWKCRFGQYVLPMIKTRCLIVEDQRDWTASLSMIGEAPYSEEETNYVRTQRVNAIEAIRSSLVSSVYSANQGRHIVDVDYISQVGRTTTESALDVFLTYRNNLLGLEWITY